MRTAPPDLADLIKTLEKDGVEWTITADKNSAVMSLIDRIGERDWTPFLGAAGEAVEVAETVHTMAGTNRAFRPDRETGAGELKAALLLSGLLAVLCRCHQLWAGVEHPRNAPEWGRVRCLGHFRPGSYPPRLDR